MGGVEQGGGASEGASDEERAEAEKFNAMVDEGKLTPAEMEQLEKEKMPEEVEAEKAAMEKVIDPLKGRYLTHSTSCGCLPEILKYGLVSLDLARRARSRGMKIEEPEKQFHISDESRIDMLNHEGFDTISTYKILGDNAKAQEKDVAIMISKSYFKPPWPITTDGEEYSAHRRIKPNAFIGLVLIRINWLGTPRVRVDLGVDVQSEKYQKAKKAAISKALPLYDDLGSLWWPRQMTHEQVQQFVAEKDAKKKAEEQK